MLCPRSTEPTPSRGQRGPARAAFTASRARRSGGERYGERDGEGDADGDPEGDGEGEVPVLAGAAAFLAASSAAFICTVS